MTSSMSTISVSTAPNVAARATSVTSVAPRPAFERTSNVLRTSSSCAA